MARSRGAAAEPVDDYIAAFPDETKLALNDLRRTISGALPGAEETISYGIPTYKIDGLFVVYFAGFKKNVSVYPLISRLDFEDEVAPYRSGRATAKFPLDAPLPLALIAKIATHLLAENQLRAVKRPSGRPRSS